MQASADNIATFVEVVRHNSLSAAARAGGLPKSTVSRRLMRLEEELGAQLLHRDARKLTLTQAGRRFYEAVVAAVDTLGAAVVELEESQSTARGTVRLTAPSDLGRMVLAPMLVAFLERYPEISLDLMFTNRVVDLVGEGLDLAVRAGRVAGSELIARRLCDSELKLAASRSVVQKLGPLLRSLEHEPFVLYRAPARMQLVRLERSEKRVKTQELTLRGRVSVDDYAAMVELVAAGQGLGLMPAMHVRAGEEAGRLVPVFPEWSVRSANVYLVYASRKQPERVRLLSEFLRESFAHAASV